ncbi:hypothetical protein M409DRAFT_63732 [Zasmidium cellare ATCC 36951]|uniref:NAD dependent epimerase/dehydratase n=1 Tax=Zasmidium cellare ATCC 36951 TaxID=1080233 RepID=A0A6A6D1G1_ZASCE|nr:uncharacterized protein M409DRAFT_63732 [Zasmidium cellare ATCC 36951]KAF2171476.1 hypothetical protein M409DRAFT_63732 [Zasmidium cellare ATCC 36951]
MESNRKTKSLNDAWNPRATKETYNLKPHPQTGRLIDNHPGKRTTPMRVLVLGMSRTGTMSVFASLEQLGFHPYHMTKAISSPKSNLDVWREGIDAKFYGKGKKWGREEFDKILGNYDSIADVPGVSFAEELITAYPEAKVILNHRDVDQWLASMQSTAGTVLRWRAWEQMSPWDPALAQPFWRFANSVMPATYGVFNDFSPQSPARRVFLEHYERVKKVTPRHRLLEYRVQQGWGPICRFLDLPIPDEDFPRINDKKEFLFAHAIMWYLSLGKMVVKVSLMAAPVLAVSVALWQRESLKGLRFW